MATADGWTYGGYSYKFVDRYLPDEYLCHICMLVARDPQQVTCCYKIYCKSCLDTLKKKGEGFICPTCRSSLEGKYFKDGRVERGIKSLKVYCTNTDSRCQWIGTIKDIETHLETCPKAIIPCEYNTVGCDKGMKREEQEKHNEESITAHLQLTKEQLEVTNDQLELTIEQLQVTNEHLQLTDQQLKVAIKTIQSLKVKVQEHENLLTTSSEVLKLSQFSQRKEGWHSRGFYTSPGGYKMSLRVYPNGIGIGKGTHFSCFTYLMAGEYDDILEWPFQGEITIELLNQLEDKNHVKVVFHYNKATPDSCKKRVSQGGQSGGWGVQKFIQQTCYRLPNNCQYIKDDSLYFRVSVKATSKTKPWLH